LLIKRVKKIILFEGKCHKTVVSLDGDSESRIVAFMFVLIFTQTGRAHIRG
jgi:hypothetical protein